MERAAVLLPLPLAGPYHYRVPAEMAIAPGDFVEVPFGRRLIAAVVWGAADESLPEARLKSIARRCQAPPLPAVSRRFIEWVAAYTVHPPGTVLRMAMSVPEALHPPRPGRAVALAGTPAAIGAAPIRWTPARRRIVEVLGEGPPRPAAELAREAGAGPTVIAGLVRAGLLVAVGQAPQASAVPDWRRAGPALSAEQAAAAEALRAAIGAGYSVTLLDGVAGSGKTEVYFEAIAETLKEGRQALVLLPEIALGAQWLTRFRKRFGAAPAEWHSDLTRGYRRRTWRAIAEGEARVVVGARSALFLPFPELGLVVVDEEHEAAFKQEDGVAYNARDMAVVRARLGEIPAVLASATPSLETMINVHAGRYRSLRLAERHSRALPPSVDVVDIRKDRPTRGAWLAPRVRAAVAETLASGSEALLFLNRRGYAPLTLCRRCGHRMQCPRCTAWLVEHRLTGRLQCHHCGYARRLPERCPACDAEDSLVGCGPGVERIAEEVEAAFPGVRYALATSDTLTGPRAASELVRRLEKHRIDVVIGTQILAKGYHFPLLTLAVVVDADLGLSGGDLRAAERTYQLLSQVAGRAGRGERPGRVMLQTAMPEHPVIAALVSGDRDRFLHAEAADRREAGMPPFGRLAAIIVSARDEAAADTAARTLARAAPPSPGVRVLGPAPAPLALLRGRYRRRLLVMAERRVAVPAWIRRWLAKARLPGSVRVQVDIDPYSFL